jgi:transposase-like protein
MGNAAGLSLKPARFLSSRWGPPQYRVFSLSLRDVELILAERGIVVSYETVRRWCKKFAASFADRRRRRRPGDK